MIGLVGDYRFANAAQFWSELEDTLAVSPAAQLDTIDFAANTFISLAAAHITQYLASAHDLNRAILLLLDSPLFAAHTDRLTNNVVSHIVASATAAAADDDGGGADATLRSNTLFFVLVVILHMGLSNPLEQVSGANLVHAAGTGSPRVYRALRRQWAEVVPVLANAVTDDNVSDQVKPTVDDAVVNSSSAAGLDDAQASDVAGRIGATAAAVLYETCRVQKLSASELAAFDERFVERLFVLVEQTRDAADETFNYTLIKLIIALNEQYMVASLPERNKSASGGGLQKPLEPEKLHNDEPNVVLRVMRRRLDESKTFGENIIFILNRTSSSTPDALCVALLILKILYLLFTTSGTHEYFYTNDLCVLVDVFIRELEDLGPESEGLRHTYLRVLHPLLTNTQLRHFPYKRPHVRSLLRSLIANSAFRTVDSTTKRLVERCLRGSWCRELDAAEESAAAAMIPTSQSVLSINTVAGTVARKDSAASSTASPIAAQGAPPAVLVQSAASLPPQVQLDAEMAGQSISRPSSAASQTPSVRSRRRAAPPPPTAAPARSREPTPPSLLTPSHPRRRAAPEPPRERSQSDAATTQADAFKRLAVR